LNILRTIIGVDNYIKQVSVIYDPDTDEYKSNGIFTQPRDFGGVGGMDHMDNLLAYESYYFHGMNYCLKIYGFVEV
jgi:hypothetical protein